ncbi:YolD-like family protein [Neobacillus cucumis]|uniref:YolD-like family protein n=1 Tax=Neobacillus cucumis TaxID=1740721 RepID=UPI00399CBA00
MENNLAVKLTVWTDGFTDNVIGCVHHVDPISHQVHIETKPGEIKRISLGDIVSVTLID